MNPDPQPGHSVVTYTYDCSDHLIRIDDPTGIAQGPPPQLEPPPPRPRAALFDWEHDREKGVFRIRWPDGTVEVFRDKPARHLVVEPDAETGQWKPVVQRGCPTYLYLCREEREVR